MAQHDRQGTSSLTTVKFFVSIMAKESFKEAFGGRTIRWFCGCFWGALLKSEGKQWEKCKGRRESLN